MEMDFPSAPLEGPAPAPRSFRDLLFEATPRFWVTPALVALNVGWFVTMVILGVSPTSPDILELQRYGANFGPLTLSGEWWRVLASTFVHIGLLHLFFNMWCLWSLGALAERMFGNGTFLLIYIASGLGGSLASLAWHPHITSAGASGAVFGIAGALGAFLYLGHLHLPARLLRELRWSLVFFVGFNLLFGALVAGIDNAGHIGGLVVGLVMGAALHRPLPVAPRSPLRYLVVPLVALGLFAAAGVAQERAKDDAYLFVADAARLYSGGDPETAIARLEHAIDLDPELTPAFVQLGIIELGLGRFEEAADALEHAVALQPDSAALRSEVGLAYLMGERYDEAVDNLREAAALEPEESESYNRLALALARRGSGEDALEAIQRAIELSPDAPHLLDSLGTVHFYRDELGLAVEAYRQAVDLEPRAGAYHFNLGVALRKQGDVEEAADQIAEARRLDPELEASSEDAPLL